MILFFGPYSPPVNGQSLAFKSVVDHWDSEKYLIDTTRFESRYINTIYVLFAIIRLFLLKSDIKTVYFTCTRSITGNFKDMVLLWFCRINKTRVVNHLHGSDFKNFVENYPTIFKRLLSRAYQHVDISIALTNSMKEEFSAFPKMKVAVVNNFYASHFDQDKLPMKSKFTVTFFSNLLYSKGIMDFLEAAKKVSDPEVVFRIAGKFTTDQFKSAKAVRRDVEAFIRDNPEINIDLRNSIPVNRRWEFLSGSDIFILPTFYPTEGIPLSIIEAMRCGNAIITTDFKYIPDLVSPKNGVLVSTRQPSEISREILNFKANPKKLREIQSHNIKVAKQHYNETRYLDDVFSILKLQQ